MESGDASPHSKRRDESMPRVLLIEDSATQAAQFAMMLKSAGFDVEISGTLSAGLERLQRGGIDTLLLDLNLPDSEGIETFRTASANAGRTPIVLLTHVDDESLAATTLQQGAQDYLVKGEVNQSWLSRAIQNAIARGRSEPGKSPGRETIDVNLKPETVVQIETRDDVTIASINEKQLLDARVIGELSDYLVRRIAAGCRKLVIGFAQVEYVSNGAIGVLLVLRRRILTQNGKLCLCELRDGVAEQFTARQFHRLFDIYSTTDAAIVSLAGRDTDTA
jgi:anti-anti-sigma factor